MIFLLFLAPIFYYISYIIRKFSFLSERNIYFFRSHPPPTNPLEILQGER